MSIENPFEKDSIRSETIEKLKIENSKIEQPKEEVKIVKEIKQEEPKDEPEYLKILREHNYIESNIGVGNKYWKIRP